MDTKRKKQLAWQLPFLLILIVATVIIIRQQHDTPYQDNKGMVFGTFYHITYQNQEDLQHDIEQQLAKVDQALSMFNTRSAIARINRNETDTCSSMLAEVVTMAIDISNETQGAFDITVAPLVNLWGFGFKQGSEPSKQAVDSLRQFIGYEKIDLQGNRLHKAHPAIQLDCSAIAKGYGVDAVARLLLSRGVRNFMIEIGGEVVTHGNSPRRLPWRIGVNKPVDDSLNVSDENMAVLNVTDKAMATSGNYRNFYYKDGKKYAHTIDPKTGYPVQHSLLSATVLAQDCATADAYATAFMVMGIEKAKAVLARHPELMAYFIYCNPSGQLDTWHSPSMEGKILQ